MREGKGLTMFYICRHLRGYGDCRIHKETCRYYLNRNAEAPTTWWSEAFPTLQAAQDYIGDKGKPGGCCVG